MTHKRGSHLLFSIISLILIIPVFADAEEYPILQSRIKFKKSKASIYYFFQQISEQTGKTFFYDSQLINNSKTIKLSKKEYSIGSVIREIVNNKNIEIKIIDPYILLIPTNNVHKYDTITTFPSKKHTQYTTLKGTIYNSENREPIPYCSVGILNSTIGTITNNEGRYQITIPDSLIGCNLLISHIGYKNKVLNTSICIDRDIELYLEQHAIALSEAVINMIDPLKLLDSMNMHIPLNYAREAVNITGFYREGIDYKNKHIELTECVLNSYKPGLDRVNEDEQAKILKMRKVAEKSVDDSIRAIIKLKSGILASFLLDIVKHRPDFLEINPKENNLYQYEYSGVCEIDDRKVYIISFKQNKSIAAPLYIGDIYIDADNFALLEARFSINPQYIKDATNLYVSYRRKGIQVELKKVEYIVSYKQSIDDLYYINYLKGNLEFSIKNKKMFFYTSKPISTWFAFTNCHIKTEDIERFPRKDRINANNIFSENKFTYDPDFWGQFNIILPEKELEQMIRENINQIISNFE